MLKPVSPKARIFWPVLGSVFAADFITKRLVVMEISPAHVPHPVIGDFFRLTLAYNRDAAMGLSLGQYSRVGFAVTAAIILVVLAAVYRGTPETSRAPVIAIALVAAGALGNLTDRLTSSLGVIDFIDIGIGDTRFYTFNVADSAITCGAILLALLSLKGERETKRHVSEGRIQKET
ncbi:MAG TPA: signal peptidase II [Gemmatimonadaceae bacterium]|nr:signal peptidase II [Gemmatimonadaceae bacterium]